MGSITPVGSAVIRDVFVPPLPLAMDHPAQDIPDGSCHNEREKRVLGHAVGQGLLTLTSILLGLRVAFTGLADIASALVVCVLGRSRRLIGNVVQGFPHLIQNLLGCVMLLSALLIIA